MCIVAAAGCAPRDAPKESPKGVAESESIGRIRQVLARIPGTLAKNHKTFVGPDGTTVQGFGAGSVYPQIWLRDSAWIVPTAAAYYEADTLTSWLDVHLSLAEKNGRLRDWVARAPPEAFREWAPRVTALGAFAADTNTNESDQEPSAALAYCRAVEALGSAGQSSGPKHEGRVIRLIAALDALVRDRTDKKSGLIWSGLTADWGDVSPVYADQRAIYLDAKTPRTLSLYSNVMAIGALDCLAKLVGPKEERERLAARAQKLNERTRAAFWMKDRGYFRIRRTLDPAPSAFGEAESDRFALGGNALAVRFGVADEAQATSIFDTAERLRSANGFSTISTTLIPPYASGVFLHGAMREPLQYQNGGQWDWFGAALVDEEFERGYSEQARAHLDQIVTRILKAGPEIHEWYAQDGTPKGSGTYAAAASAIHGAVVQGLLGVSRSGASYRVVIRSAETLSPFEVPQRAASGRLVLRQTVDAEGIDVQVDSTLPVREVCTLVPAGRQPMGRAVEEAGLPRSVRRVGKDTLMCADISAESKPIRLRFPLAPR